MLFNIIIVVQVLIWGSWVNAQFTDGMYYHSKNNKCYACPKLFEGFCKSRRYSPLSALVGTRFEIKAYLIYWACTYCYDGCTQYVDGRYNCRDCKPGRWGAFCQYSCIPCSECYNFPCRIHCIDRNDTIACVNSECPDSCSVGFFGIRKSEKDACPMSCIDCRDKQCHRCDISLYLYVQNGTQICKHCPTETRSCRLDTVRNNTIQAIRCNHNYYLHKQDGLVICKRCPYMCTKCYLKTRHNTLQCIRCEIGYYLDTSNQNGMIRCRKCPLGYEECKLNTFHNNTIQCVRSAFGYYLNANNQDEMVECRKCPKPCLSCKLDTIQKETQINCISCLNGYYLDIRGKFKTCNKCPERCETCKQPGHPYLVECTSCIQGFFFNYDKNAFSKCTLCPYGCKACGLVSFHAKIPYCTRCEDGFSFQIKDGMGVCDINTSRLDVSLEVIVTVVSIVTVSIVAIGVACFKLRQKTNTEEKWEIPLGGSISYYPEQYLGHGSEGRVYKGRYGRQEKRPVAVKVIKFSNDRDAKELENIYKEIKTMETLVAPADITNIIHFIDSYKKENTVYLAFELAIGTLVDYISNASWQLLLTRHNVIRSIIAGLNYTHKQNIVHRDLKPGNIFIVDRVSGLIAVIGDFGRAKATTGSMFTYTGKFGSNAYTAPEITATVSIGTKVNKASDIFSLGLVVYYTISLGKHPFGHENTAQDSISKGNPPNFHDIATLINSFAYEDLLKGMLNNNPDDRPSIAVVSEHPALWTSDKIIKYFLQKSDEFESQIKTGTLNDQLLEDPSLITEPCGIWMNLLPVNLKTYLRNYRLNSKSPTLYKGKKSSIRYFLRAIRNTTAHYKTDYPKNTQSPAELGTFPDGHVLLWLTVCPKLLMHIYTKLP